jgi:hypothetical protein
MTAGYHIDSFRQRSGKYRAQVIDQATHRVLYTTPPWRCEQDAIQAARQWACDNMPGGEE